MLNITMLQQMLIIAIAMSSISCAFIQKTKKYLKNSKYIIIYSFIINIIFSIIFCMTFTNVPFPESLWIGLFSFIGADTLYKTLEKKLTSYTDLVKKEYIEVPKENLINIEEEE